MVDMEAVRDSEESQHALEELKRLGYKKRGVGFTHGGKPYSWFPNGEEYVILSGFKVVDDEPWKFIHLPIIKNKIWK